MTIENRQFSICENRVCFRSKNKYETWRHVFVKGNEFCPNYFWMGKRQGKRGIENLWKINLEKFYVIKLNSKIEIRVIKKVNSNIKYKLI